MRIVVESTGTVLLMSQIVSSNFRTDLIPVPVNAEVTVKLNDELEKSLVDGAVILVGADGIRMTIIKSMHLKTQIVVEDKRFKAMSFIAILSGCETLIDPLSKAVILNGTDFASAYRACGCKMKFNKDIPLLSFISAYGSIPTIEVAHCLQQESAVIFYKDGKLNAQRLKQFFQQEPVLELDDSAVAWVNNSKVEQSQVSDFISVAEDGSIIEGGQKDKSPTKYLANSDARRLKNMGEILITRGTITRAMNMEYNAGDIFLISNKKYLVLTAVHALETGALGGGSVTASRYWIATMSS